MGEEFAIDLNSYFLSLFFFSFFPLSNLDFEIVRVNFLDLSFLVNGFCLLGLDNYNGVLDLFGFAGFFLFLDFNAFFKIFPIYNFKNVIKIKFR